MQPLGVVIMMMSNDTGAGASANDYEQRREIVGMGRRGSMINIAVIGILKLCRA